jgi:hypothetical protein
MKETELFKQRIGMALGTAAIEAGMSQSSLHKAICDRTPPIVATALRLERGTSGRVPANKVLDLCLEIARNKEAK